MHAFVRACARNLPSLFGLQEMRIAFDKEAREQKREPLVLTATVPAFKKDIDKAYDVDKIKRFYIFQFLTYFLFSLVGVVSPDVNRSSCATSFSQAVLYYANLMFSSSPALVHFLIMLSMDCTVGASFFFSLLHDEILNELKNVIKHREEIKTVRYCMYML